MRKTLMIGLLATVALTGTTVTFHPVPGTGPAVPVSVVVQDIVSGVQITTTVTTGGVIGDLRGVFLDLSILPQDLDCGDITGALVTGCAIGLDSVVDLGNGDNLHGLGHLFDFGVGLGTPGIGSDDIQVASFQVTHPLLTASMFTGAGVRLTSVGVTGQRTDSSKLYSSSGATNVDAPEPGTLPCMAFFTLLGLWRRGKK